MWRVMGEGGVNEVNAIGPVVVYVCGCFGGISNIGELFSGMVGVLLILGGLCMIG